MRALLLAALLLCAPTTSALAIYIPEQEAEEYINVWRNVGTDPCSANPACSPEWAMARAVLAAPYSQAVADQLLEKVANEAPRPAQVCPGMMLDFNTGGGGETGMPRFYGKTKVAFADGKCREADAWRVRHEGVTYTFAKVKACGNWDGWTSELPKVEDMTPVPIGVPTPKYLGSLPDSFLTPVWPWPGGTNDGGGNGDFPKDPPQPVPEPPWSLASIVLVLILLSLMSVFNGWRMRR